jgi:tetratricopeptide (TPR) repeat protein
MRKPSPSPRLRLEELPTRELIARGETCLATQDYKDAIDVYKLLLKREPQAGWRESLASAYLERAKQLASKGMYREAAVLWENLPSLCGQIRQPELYIGWLLQTSQYAKAMRAYAQHATNLSSAGELEARLAALTLAGQKEVLQALPQDAPLRRQLNLAQAALHAYGQGEAEPVVRECLQNIPIRSPYRDLRQTLSALLKLDTDPAGAPALIERIPPTSPYHDLAEIVRACAAREPARALLALDSVQRDLAAHLLGLNSQHIKLLKEWARLGEQPNDKTLFGFITNNLAALGHEKARQACLALLAVYPRGQPTYVKLFGPLPTLEAHRLQALQAEQEEEPHRALRCWQACIDELAKDRKNPDSRLMAALVLRHMAELAQHEHHGWDDDRDVCQYLEQSLDFDPDDRDTYLKLAAIYKEADEDKEYHQWVERAVKQFPDDPQVLMAAVVTATARKAYKKAAGFAERVLALDPINSKARAVLINAHLAHARKQMIAGKYTLAQKELDSASQLERDNARSGIVEINRGLLAFRQHQPELMQHGLREGVRLAGSPLLGWFRLAVEASRLQLEPTTFQRDLGLGDPRKFTASRADLLTLTQWVNAYQEEGVQSISSVLEDLEKPLKRTIKELSKEEDLLSVCECFHQAPHYELLEYAATGALQHCPERPIFIYYQIYGRTEGDVDDIKDRDYDRLENALDAAKAVNDKRTEMRIARFLYHGAMPFRRPGNGPRSMPMPFPAMPPKMRRELEEAREELEQMPPALRERMLNQLLDSLPHDDDFPPEVQRAIMKALLLGGDGLEDLLNMDMDIDDFSSPSRGRPRRRRR